MSLTAVISISDVTSMTAEKVWFEADCYRMLSTSVSDSETESV